MCTTNPLCVLHDRKSLLPFFDILIRKGSCCAVSNTKFSEQTDLIYSGHSEFLPPLEEESEIGVKRIIG